MQSLQRHCPLSCYLRGWHRETCCGSPKELTWLLSSSISQYDKTTAGVTLGITRSTFDLKPWTLRAFPITTNIMVFHCLLKHMLKLQHFTSHLQKAADPLGKHFIILQAPSDYRREMKQCHNTPLVDRVTLHGLSKSGGNPGTVTCVHRHHFVRTGGDSDCCQQCLFV